MKVRSVMLPHSTITIDSSWTLAEISRFFKSMRTEYLSIANHGRFVGVLSRERFRRFLEESDYSLDRMSSTSVRAVMDDEENFCEPDHDIFDAFSMMKERNLSYLVVKSLGKVVGVISFSSVAAAVATAMGKGSEVAEG